MVSYFKIYLNLLYGPDIRNLGVMFFYMNGSVAYIQVMEVENSTYKCCASRHHLPINRDLLEVINALFYMTHIPFGEKGYKFAKEELKRIDPSLNLEELRLNRMIEVLKRSDVELSEEQLSVLKRACFEYTKSQFDLNDTVDFMIFSRRISSELENSVAYGRVPNNYANQKDNFKH